MEKIKLIDGMVVPFSSLLAVKGGDFSPIEAYRDFCKENNIIDNKTRGFKGVQVIDGSKVSSSKETSFPYSAQWQPTDYIGSLEQDDIEETVWSYAFVHKDSVLLVPFLALNHNPKSIEINKDTPVRLVFWEKEVDIEREGRHSPLSGLANLHELDRRGK